MTKLYLALTTTLALTGSHAFAAGDAEKGEAVFKKCQTCHSITDTGGQRIAGTGAKMGPDLYGVIGRTAGTYEGFSYGDSIKAAGEKGLTWDEEHIVAYVQDPTGFLRDYLDDKKARGKMMFKLPKETDAQDVAAYLKSVGPAQ